MCLLILSVLPCFPQPQIQYLWSAHLHTLIDSHTHTQPNAWSNLVASWYRISIFLRCEAMIKPRDTARQLSFLQHPTLVSMQRWPETDIDNWSLINRCSSSSQCCLLFPACLAGWLILRRVLFNILVVQQVVMAKHRGTRQVADERQTLQEFQCNLCEVV